MDEQFRRFLRDLAINYPHIYRLVVLLLGTAGWGGYPASTSGLTIAEILAALRVALGDSALWGRLVAWLTRLGIVSTEVVATVEAEVVLTAAAATPWWAAELARPGPGWAIILWIIAILAWIAATKELTTDLDLGTPPGPVCLGSGVDRLTRIADDTSWGCRYSHNDRVAEARGFCATLSAECTGTCSSGGSCEPDVHIIGEEQFTVPHWTLIGCRTVLEYTCECTCKH
ncbi:hypothetical protein P886_0744 [Alteromonadaceae bacterium 2753L.S.0a.02]|nr:hypothetical protein P886_0744 [Alteromonadaceae bacterium 2753L.S.0a.02]